MSQQESSINRIHNASSAYADSLREICSKLWLIWRSFFFPLCDSFQKERRIPVSKWKICSKDRWRVGREVRIGRVFTDYPRGGGNGKHRHLNWTCWSRELRGLMKISKRKYQSFHHGRVKLVGACIFKVGEQGSRSLKTQQIFFRFDRPIGRSRLNSRLFRGKGKILFLISALLYPFD